MQNEPIMDVAHLAHLEIFSAVPDKSLSFFVDVLGMTVSGTKGDSVYLRGWDDYERYSLKLTGSKTSEPAGAGTSRRSAEGIRLRGRLDRRRHRARAGLSIPRS